MNQVVNNKKTIDIIILCVINILAIAISFTLETNFLTSTVLFLGVPSLYLIFRVKKQLPKILIAALITGSLFGFFFDFIAELNNAWNWNGGLLFGKILGVIQIDVLIWFFLWVLQIFLFYEYFIDRSKMAAKFSKQAYTITTLLLVVVALEVIIFKLNPALLYFDKAYFVMAMIVAAPMLYFVLKKPKLVLRSMISIPYFFFVYFTHEITALKLEQWTFPGDYIFKVNFFNEAFPVEELIFWMILSSLIAGVYYELSFDNQRN